jgi:hypothetical protein
VRFRLPYIPLATLAAEQLRDTAYILIDGREYPIVRNLNGTWATTEPVSFASEITIPAGCTLQRH